MERNKENEIQNNEANSLVESLVLLWDLWFQQSVLDIEGIATKQANKEMQTK